MSGVLDCGLRRIPSNVWLVTTVAAVLVAMSVYGYGFVQGFPLQFSEACGAVYQPIDDAYIAAQKSGSSPLSQPCNAGYDLVPPFVILTILVLLATGVVNALVYAFGADIRREPASGAG